MDFYSISNKLEELALGNKNGISKSDSYRSHAAGAGKAAAETTMAYKKRLAVTLIKLKNGVELELDGEKIQNPPATISVKIAEGICADEGMAMDVALNSWRLGIENLKNLTTQITALQSLLKSFSHTAEL